MSYVSIKDMSEEEAERKREQRRGYAKTYRAKQKAKAQEAEAQQDQKQQIKQESEIKQEEQGQEEEWSDVLTCSCGHLLYSDRTGMFPHVCKHCGEVVDYRGVVRLEESPDILVCDNCGCLTRLKPNGRVICEWCGQEYDGVQ